MTKSLPVAASVMWRWHSPLEVHPDASSQATLLPDHPTTPPVVPKERTRVPGPPAEPGCHRARTPVVPPPARTSVPAGSSAMGRWPDRNSVLVLVTPAPGRAASSTVGDAPPEACRHSQTVLGVV